MPKALSLLRCILFTIPLIVLSTVAGGIVVLAVSGLKGSGRLVDAVTRLWARAVVAASLVRIRSTGTEQIARATTYIFCSNHLSYLDPPVILASLPHHFRFLAKKSLFPVPIF